MAIKVNKRKILNDPVYGFISIHDTLLFEIIEHPYFQRLRRIKQLGLTHLVYPGALHTRFQHAIGTMHLMQKAIEVLRLKGQEISEEERLGACIAILLHDIGHGPFSHTLEHSIVKNMNHEELSDLFIDALNKEFDGKLEIGKQIFKNQYHKTYLHQFFSGVSEGIISSDRIITMLDVVDDKLVVEAKGIYSLEKFIIARRLMYWQTYMHKTVLVAEHILMKILQRAKKLSKQGADLFSTSPLKLFLKNDFTFKDFKSEPKLLQEFAKLDDFDIQASIKEWMNSDDFILSFLSKTLTNRRLFKIEISNNPFSKNHINTIKQKAMKTYNLSEEEIGYIVFTDITHNRAYNPKQEKINILNKDNSVIDIDEASSQINVQSITKIEYKHFLCYPKTLKPDI
ncbi:MAG: HD domain-containing protein [Bacteroidota bacterium]|nr:HD domain-containing protein [Bacteroidota bacterium]